MLRTSSLDPNDELVSRQGSNSRDGERLGFREREEKERGRNKERRRARETSVNGVGSLSSMQRTEAHSGMRPRPK